MLKFTFVLGPMAACVVEFSTLTEIDPATPAVPAAPPPTATVVMFSAWVALTFRPAEPLASMSQLPMTTPSVSSTVLLPMYALTVPLRVSWMMDAPTPAVSAAPTAPE